MKLPHNLKLKDTTFVLCILSLLAFSVVILNSLERSIFPTYFLYIGLSILAFWLFSVLGFEVASVFSKYFYIGSIILLLVTLVFGGITRGTVRWIHFGPGSFQPAEIVRPFLLLFFANYLGSGVTKRRIILPI